MNPPDPEAAARAEARARHLATVSLAPRKIAPLAQGTRTALAREEYKDDGAPRRLRGVYILLCLLFGGLGAHNFYAGRYLIATIQLVLNFVLVVWFPLGLLGTLIWNLVELFAVRRDGRGHRLY